MIFNPHEEVQKCKKYFDRHQITTVVNESGVSRFIYKRPDSGMYGFSLTCADNLIVLNGDIYTLVVEPGYGRNGLAFLLSHVTRDPFYYFLSKVPYRFKEALYEFSPEKAEENMKYYIKEEYITEEDLDDWSGRGESGRYGEFKYYEFCHEKDIDEPMSPHVVDGQTIMQIAGLQCFVEQYKKENNVKED